MRLLWYGGGLVFTIGFAIYQIFAGDTFFGVLILIGLATAFAVVIGFFDFFQRNEATLRLLKSGLDSVEDHFDQK